jgi:hypothetical protein
MPGTCASCFRETKSDVSVCSRCVRVTPSASWSIVAIALIIYGVVMWDTRACIGGALVGVIACARALYASMA